jgi:hypothetical protein
MKASDSLIILYEVIYELKGPIHAKEFLSTAVYNVVSEILEEGLTLTAEEIDRRLAKEAHDYKSMSDHHKKSIA